MPWKVVGMGNRVTGVPQYPEPASALLGGGDDGGNGAVSAEGGSGNGSEV